MKERNFTNGSPYFQATFQVRCWTPNKINKQAFFKHFFRRYQNIIDTMFAVTIIGAMFLMGIWCFLVQLAEF